MKYTATVSVAIEQDGKEKIIALFAPEDKELSNGRAKYSIKTEEKEVVFNVEAQDAVALRATLTSISKTLSIFEETKQIIDSEKNE